MASSSSAAPQPTKSLSTPRPNHAEAWIQMRAASPTSFKNEPVTPIKPARQLALGAQSAASAAVTNMDFSSPSGQCKGDSSIQQQPAVESFPACHNEPNKKAAPQLGGSSNLAQTTFQPLQAAVNSKASFQIPARFGCNIQPEATLSSASTFQQSQPPCSLPDTNHPFSGQVQQQSRFIFSDPNVHSVSYPQQQQPVPFYGTENRFVSRQFPFPAAAPPNPVSQVSSV